MNTEYKTLVEECALQGQKLNQLLSYEGILEPLYLYYRASEQGKGPGKLFLVRDSTPAPEWAKLATGEGLRANIPYDRYYQWVYERATRCPILAY
jgi:hypothetical protein